MYQFISHMQCDCMYTHYSLATHYCSLAVVSVLVLISTLCTLPGIEGKLSLNTLCTCGIWCNGGVSTNWNPIYPPQTQRGIDECIEECLICDAYKCMYIV